MTLPSSRKVFLYAGAATAGYGITSMMLKMAGYMWSISVIFIILMLASLYAWATSTDPYCSYLLVYFAVCLGCALLFGGLTLLIMRMTFWMTVRETGDDHG